MIDVPAGLGAADHALFIVLAVFFPLRASMFGVRRLRRAATERLPDLRLSLYRQAIALQWTLTAIVLARWISQRRSWAELGVVPVVTPGLIGIAIGVAIVVVFVLRQRAQALADPDALEQVRARLEHMEILLPHRVEEKRWFDRLAITAGLCEELLYRGYMIWYAAHWTGMIQAAGVAAILFGIGHSYQGWKGILQTTAVGALLGAVYLLAGSLYPAMVIHALMDLHAGHVSFAALQHQPEPPDDEPPPEAHAEIEDGDDAIV